MTGYDRRMQYGSIPLKLTRGRWQWGVDRRHGEFKRMNKDLI